MNRDSIIGFILIAAILVGYTIWMTPSKEELAQRQHKLDSIAFVREQQRIADSVRILNEVVKLNEESAAEEVQLPVNEQNNDQVLLEKKNKFGRFAMASSGTDTVYYFENDVLKLGIAAQGGYVTSVELKKYQTWDSLPLIVFDPKTAVLDLSFFSQNKTINTANLFFQPFVNGKPLAAVGQNMTNASSDSLSISMRLFADDGNGNIDPTRYISYEYVIHPEEYMVDFNLHLQGMDDIIASNSNFLSLDWKADLLKQEKSIDRFNGSTIYYKHLNDDVEYMSETKDSEESIRTRVKWVSFKQRFFTTTLIADNYFDNADMRTLTQEQPANPRYLKTMYATVELPYSASPEVVIPMSFYFGPNSFYELRSHRLELEHQIPLGWSFFLLAWINMYIVIPVFTFLGSYGWNYGIVILVLTILLKMILFPIAYKTYNSSAKMRVLKPEIDEISAKYPNKDDAMKKQQAVMALYKKAGANPMAGCIPMLLQMPILIAMFRFFPSSIELRQQPFLWATDLSSYDSILNLPWEIPFYGDHVSLFTLLMTISTIIYTHVNNEMMGQQNNQLPGMKTMMYLMPVMFLGLFNNYASGLSYYYLLANLITFAQMYIFRLTINEDKLRAKIEENKKKPVKKSGFQKRLEDAAKQRGYKMPK